MPSSSYPLLEGIFVDAHLAPEVDYWEPTQSGQVIDARRRHAQPGRDFLNREQSNGVFHVHGVASADEPENGN